MIISTTKQHYNHLEHIDSAEMPGILNSADEIYFVWQIQMTKYSNLNFQVVAVKISLTDHRMAVCFQKHLT